MEETKEVVPDTPPVEPRESIDFKVIYNKQKINVDFALDGTVGELKAHLQNIILVPQAMQKVMIKGLAKDDQTLRSLGVTKGDLLRLNIQKYEISKTCTFQVPKL